MDKNLIIYGAAALLIPLVVWAITASDSKNKRRRNKDIAKASAPTDEPSIEVRIDPRAKILMAASLDAMKQNLAYLRCYNDLTDAAYRHRNGPRL